MQTCRRLMFCGVGRSRLSESRACRRASAVADGWEQLLSRSAVLLRARRDVTSFACITRGIHTARYLDMRDRGVFRHLRWHTRAGKIKDLYCHGDINQTYLIVYARCYSMTIIQSIILGLLHEDQHLKGFCLFTAINGAAGSCGEHLSPLHSVN